MKFNFIPQEIPEVILVLREKFEDERGIFTELFRENIFLEHGIGPFVQDNFSLSNMDVIRGLHYQDPPMEVGKLVTCLSGTIWDVAVDIRPDSPTYKKWVAATLDEGTALWVPPGFAHGFCCLSGQPLVLYKQTQYYSKEHDRVIRFDDPSLRIPWPVTDPLVSKKDQEAPLL